METPGESLSLALLPERRTNWRALGTAFALQSLLLLLLVQLGLIQPQQLLLKSSYRLTPLVVATDSHHNASMRRPVRPRLLPPAPLVARRELSPPPTRHVEAPQVKLPAATTPKLVEIAGGARPPVVVRTGEFGSSVQPTVNKPVEKVQTGGFGDERGAKTGSSATSGHLIMANLGSFDMPSGAGQGNGSGGQHGTIGTVASAGFGSNIANPSQGDGRSNGRGSVQQGGFGDTRAVTASASRPAETVSPITPVEVLSKPTPVYTAEARQLHIEGEVLLKVMFAASGEAHVLGVVRGLGHGLDEAATVAASKIRFRPAQRDGQPVDSTAVLHVIFQLAN